MEVHLLGTAGYHPNENRHTACMMVPEAGVILDAGTGFFRVRDLIQTPDLHIFMSHCHLDHCVGLSFFIDVIHEKNIENIFVYGAEDKLKSIQQHLFSEDLFPLQPDFHWTPLTGDDIALPMEGTAKTIALEHPGGSLGFRLEWPGQSLAYITDTTARVDANYIPFIQGVDLLLHECHFPDGMEKLAETTGHSCLTPVAEVCRAANVKQAVIVHLNPLLESNPPLDLATVDSIYHNLTLGADRMKVRFPANV